jgi:PAS domain S-box-containing protein
MLTRPVLPFLQFLAVPAPDAPPRALEMLPVAFYACDREGRILWFNQKAAELWQRTPAVSDSGERFCGFVKTYVNGQEIAPEATEMAKVLRTGVAVDGVQSIVERPDGSRIRIMMHIEPVRDEQGELIGALNCFHNATAVHTSDSELHDSDQHLAATYEHAAIGISEVDASGRLMRVNETVCRIIGYSAEELLNLTVFDVTHPDDRTNDRDCFERQVAGTDGGYTVEKRLVCKDGRVIWALVTSSSVYDSAGRFLYGIRVLQDITARKHAEEMVRDNEQRLRQLLEALPAAVYTTDAAGRVTFYNEAAVELSGREPNLGSDEWCVNWRLFRPDGTPLPYDQCPMAVALKENRAVRGEEAIAERPDGTRVPFIPYPTPLRDSRGELVGAVNMLVDITERKLAEERQKTLIDELNHRVKNTLATVQSLAAQTLRGAEATAKARDDFNARLLALSKAHDQLSRAGWQSADFRSIVEGIFAPYRIPGGNQVRLTGPSVRLPPNAALLLAMIIHELATNAAKYGALSTVSGTLDLNWATVKRDDGRHLMIEWRESGGPPVRAPKRRGFGNRLAHRAIAHELNGSAQIMFDPAGVRCKFEVPLAISPE